MKDSTESFYDDLAEAYHLIFEDWHRSIALQAEVLGTILERCTGKTSPYVLDCACGIGTQTIGLAERGHTVVGSDVSSSAIARAKAEARDRNLDVMFNVADMRSLAAIPEGCFDAVLAADNALPHLLTQHDLEQAAAEISSRLKSGGILLATLRDYDRILLTRPTVQAPSFHGQDETSRFVHQVWQWEGEQYTMHLYLTEWRAGAWSVKHFVSIYRALRRKDLEQALRAAGFADIRWMEPQETSFYQPIVVATKNGVPGSGKNIVDAFG